jgi:hypothetical protein
MLYAILCYDSEELVSAWTPEQDAAAIARLVEVEQQLAADGKLGSVARLMPTSTAMTVRKGKQPVVLDGPFAETKEQLLGFYVVECASFEEALGAARELARASSSLGAFEVRPLRVWKPGAARA